MLQSLTTLLEGKKGTGFGKVEALLDQVRTEPKHGCTGAEDEENTGVLGLHDSW
jgi:hypothetical protein